VAKSAVSTPKRNPAKPKRTAKLTKARATRNAEIRSALRTALA
jgi:hypothetical protein